MIDTTLIDRLKALADKERKIKGYKRRLRIKGKVKAIGKTKKDNITLTIEKEEQEYKFTVLKTHKERFALAQKLRIGQSVFAQGISKLRMIICTQLKALERGIGQERQEKLNRYDK